MKQTDQIDVRPSDFVAVPVKPTMEMLGAALKAGAENAGTAFAIYQAMLNAVPEIELEPPAPPPPAPQIQARVRSW